jgi:sugar lactone lactonase YvrE
VVAASPKQIAGIAVSLSGRLFLNVPRWVDVPAPSVAEVLPGGVLAPYPNAAINDWEPDMAALAAERFVCVQSVVVDADDMLWILDPASPGFAGVVPGGPKLIQIDLATDTVVRTHHFDDVSAPPHSYLNDVRFARGSAFISDSGAGGIVALHLATGNARRLLGDHPGALADPAVVPRIEGRDFTFADGTTPQVHCDGIAIDPAGEFIYFKALTARALYRAPVDVMLEEGLSPEELASAVEQVAEPGPTDGLAFDPAGNLYLTAIEEDAIKILRPGRALETFVQGPKYSWPDTIAIGADGFLYFTVSQFHRMPAFNGGIDKRIKPFEVFRVPLK